MKLSRRLVSSVCLNSLLLVLAPSLGLATAIRITPVGGTDPGCGTSWGAACDLQFALQSVAVSGDELWVKAGVYTPGSARTDTFSLRDGVSLFGGFAGTEFSRYARDWKAHVTTLSGDIGVAGYNPDNSYHVVSGVGVGASAVLDGFTLSAGNADGTEGNDGKGGGLLLENARPTVENCTFSGNSAASGGGGIFSDNVSTLSISECVFSGNSSVTAGGAIACNGNVIARACSFSNNSGGSGGAIYLSPDTGTDASWIDSCTFSGNSCAYGGGGILVNQTTLTIVNSTFSNNSTGDSGYGGAIAYSSSGGAVVNSTFSGNSTRASFSGGEGGAIFHSSGPTDTAAPTVENCILWGNAPNQVKNDASVTVPVMVDTSIVQGGCPVGSTCGGIIVQNPMLGALGDYGGPTQTMLIPPASPAVDSGDDAVCAAAPVNNKSQNGLARPQGAHCDLGALELGQQVFRSLGSFDGWILESAEKSSLGGSLDRMGTALFVGDNNLNRQFRSILAFDSSSLPDAAALNGATLGLHYAGKTGSNPFLTHGKLLFDMRKGGFSGNLALQRVDFQAPAHRVGAGTIPKTASASWHRAALNPTARGYVNKVGQTQFRLRFVMDDDNDDRTDAVKFHGGSSPYAPTLSVSYYVP